MRKALTILPFLSALVGCTVFGTGTPDTAALSLAARTKIQHLDLGPDGGQTRVALDVAAATAAPAARAAISASSNDLDDAYNNMMNYCHVTLTRFETRADTYAYWSAAIAIIGSLAGGVAVPALAARSAANKAWTSSLGGLSGATNAGQQSLNSAGLSAGAQLQSRQDVLTSWKADIAPYYDSTKTLDEQKKAIEKSFADCQLYELSTPGGTTGKK
jgi:hypothetical protein